MNEKLQAQIKQIIENFNVGFITPIEALSQTYDALICAANDIKDDKEREEWYGKVGKSFAENEHLMDAWSEISQQWCNA